MNAGFDVTKLPANMRSKIMVSVDQVETNGSVCWEWTGATNSKGYGSVTAGVKGKTLLAHRRAYMELVGPIPKGLTIDHLCFNIICMNTDHMEPVTRGENSRRALARQTHCKRGHLLSGDNLRLTTRLTGLTYRVCIACTRLARRDWMRRARAEGRYA